MLKLTVWAVPGLVILAIIGARRGWKDTRIKVLTFSALLTFFGYFLFEATQGHGWGYRHFHGAWGTLPLLACGLVAVKKSDSSKKFGPLACAAAAHDLRLLGGAEEETDGGEERHGAEPEHDHDQSAADRAARIYDAMCARGWPS